MNASWCGVEAGTLVSHKPSGRVARVGGDEASLPPTIPPNHLPVRFLDWPRESENIPAAEVDFVEPLV